jgi:serine/threonine-protein kinase
MPLQSGTILGHYAIESPIGAGGMGEVYKARDPRLNRVVAIKVLPQHIADIAERKQRFEREAQAIAALNHPHICVIYDVGQDNDVDFIVMEYLEGETLADRIAKRPIPFDQLLTYATQIADALDKAHRQGITHRDLKPGNVMITRSGVKLLDFGLAKLQQPAAAPNIFSALPTAVSDGPPLTADGMVLGTPQYMAPEQVEGKEADARTDIFAFGAVVYEMATGKRPFEGHSQASVIAAILERDPPPIASLQPMTPPALDRIVKKCLAKDPEKRWQAASDLCDALSWIAEEGVSRIATSLASPHEGMALRVGRRWILVSALACVLVVAIAGVAVWLFKPALPKPVTRFAVSLPPGQNLDRARPAIAISPDGTRLAYAASQLYVRAMDGLEARGIPGTEGARNPFFSPDSQWLGFSAGGKLKKVAVTGGAPINLSDVVTNGIFGASWGREGMIAFSPTPTGAIQQVSDAGNNPQQLTRLEKSEFSHRFPELLPGGAGLLFAIVGAGGASAKVAVQSLKAGDHQIVVQAGIQPRYTPSGHILYWQGGNLMAAPFDLRRLAVVGAAVPVIEGVLPWQYSFSSTGSLVYVPGVSQTQLRLVWVDRKGAEQPLPAPPHNYVMPRLSPDGRRVAAAVEEADSQIWLYDLARVTLTRLTLEGSGNVDPLWTPDGTRITFKGAGNRLFWQPADGNGPAEALTSGPLSPNDIPVSWSPDGQVLAFMEQGAGPRSMWTLPLRDRKPQLFDRSPLDEVAPQFSPDGHWIVYDSVESGRDEIYVRPYPGPGRKWQISTEGGTEPVWNPKGRELFYRNRDKMMAVEVTTQPSFAAGKPRVLFEGAYVLSPRTLADYDVSSDGQRFLMLKGSEQTSALTQINVVLNWTEELKQRVPVK